MLNVQGVETIHAEELENALYVYSPYTWDQYESSVFIHHTQILFTYSFVKTLGKLDIGILKWGRNSNLMARSKT